MPPVALPPLVVAAFADDEPVRKRLGDKDIDQERAEEELDTLIEAICNDDADNSPRMVAREFECIPGISPATSSKRPVAGGQPSTSTYGSSAARYGSGSTVVTAALPRLSLGGAAQLPQLAFGASLVGLRAPPPPSAPLGFPVAPLAEPQRTVAAGGSIATATALAAGAPNGGPSTAETTAAAASQSVSVDLLDLLG